MKVKLYCLIIDGFVNGISEIKNRREVNNIQHIKSMYFKEHLFILYVCSLLRGVATLIFFIISEAHIGKKPD